MVDSQGCASQVEYVIDVQAEQTTYLHFLQI